MTEDEAKTKWCPQTNGQGTPDENLCIAASCMWWVWDETYPEQAGIPDKGHCGAVK